MPTARAATPVISTRILLEPKMVSSPCYGCAVTGLDSYHSYKVPDRQSKAARTGYLPLHARNLHVLAQRTYRGWKGPVPDRARYICARRARRARARVRARTASTFVTRSSRTHTLPTV